MSLRVSFVPGEGVLLHGTTRAMYEAIAPILRANNLRWGRTIGAWFVPRSRDWSPADLRARYTVERIARELTAAGHETTTEIDRSEAPTPAERVRSIEQRAAERAERLEDRAERARREASGSYQRADEIMSYIPMGQPILVGHHSERRHRRDLDRIAQSLRKGHEAEQEAGELERRAAIAERKASGDEPPGVIARRIDKMEADARSLQKQLDAGPNDRYRFQVTDPARRAEIDARIRELDADIAYWQARLKAAGGIYGPQDFSRGQVFESPRYGKIQIDRVSPKSVTAYWIDAPASMPGHMRKVKIPYDKLGRRAPPAAAPPPDEVPAPSPPPLTYETEPSGQVRLFNPRFAPLWSRLRLSTVCDHELGGPRMNPTAPAPDPNDPNVQIVLSLSGGKDSGALLSYVVRTYGTATPAHGARFRAVYADTGMEWPDAEAVIVAQLAAVQARWGVRIPFAAVRKEDLDGDAVGILDAVERRGYFPDRQARWCTSDFKRSPINKWLRNAYTSGTESAPERVLVAMGIRSMESTTRAFARWGRNGSGGWSHPDVYMDERAEATSRRRLVWSWYPIYDWCPGPDGRTCPPAPTLWNGQAWVPFRPAPWQDVWKELEAYGVPVHPAYAQGFPRLSCAFCIFGRPDDLRRAAELHPTLFRRIADLERKTQAKIIEAAGGEGEGAERARTRLAKAKARPGGGSPVPQGSSLVEGLWLDELFEEHPEVAPPPERQLRLFRNPGRSLAEVG